METHLVDQHFNTVFLSTVLFNRRTREISTRFETFKDDTFF